MRNLIIYTVLFALPVMSLFGCKSAEKTAETKNKKEEITLILPTENVSFSIGFRMFWDDLVKETNGFEFDNYIPSEKMVSDYSLMSVDDGYHLSGFIHTNESFDANSVKDLKCNVVKFSDNISTFNIPIKNIPKFVKVKNIQRFETSTKAYLK